ncbi:SDR family oxidoreductase, partial [Pyxidicoccus sp. 3LFB2]
GGAGSGPRRTSPPACMAPTPLCPPGAWGSKDRCARPPLARPLLITGATGTLGRAFARLCKSRGLAFKLLSRKELDIASPESVARAMDAYQPWAIINAAGYVRVDDAEKDAERCFRENTTGPEVLAAACAALDVRLVTFSSDLVFGDGQATPYVEGSAVKPLNVYGRSKVEAERRVLARLPSALVVRTGAFFGPWDRHNFVTLALAALARGERFEAADDAVVSPTYVPDLVQACLDLLIDEEQGVWHLVNDGEVTWAELARQAATLVGLDPLKVHGRPMASFGLPAARPRYSALASERGRVMPSLSNALDRYLEEDEILPVQGGGRAACAVCGGNIDASHGDGWCRIHRERGDGGVAAGG